MVDIIMTSQIWMRPYGWGVEPPYFAVFRNIFEVAEPVVLRFSFSADERATLFCDGEVIADGPPRGTPERWFTATVELPLAPGKHVLTARLFAFGPALTAYGQMSVKPGIFVQDESGVLSSDWEYQLCMGCSFANSKTDWGSYAHILTDEAFNWRAFEGGGGEWKKPEYVNDPRPLESTPLPPMRCEEIHNYRQCGPFFCFDDYVCVYGDYIFSGTGEVRLRWAEPGYDAPTPPDGFPTGHKPGEPYPYFSGPGDRFQLTGERIRWRDYWWHAGRTLEMTIRGNVKIESVRFFQTGYPWELRRDLNVPGDERMTRLLRRSWRTLQACSFETLMDCAYYEQLQYISDSRFDLLSFYELTDDLRLARNVLRQLAEGQYSSGMLPCRYPTKEHAGYRPELGEYYKIHIPAFSAFYIQMVHDYARHTGDGALVQELLPTMRRAADFLQSCLGEDHLLHVPGWNFIDWLDNWEGGVPPGCRNGEGCTLNLVFLLALKDLADLEKHFGSPEAARERECLAENLSAAIRNTYFIRERGCFAEDSARSYVSEHAQVFALLALGETAVLPSLRKGDLDQCGIAFSFYYLEACRAFKQKELFLARLERYLQIADQPDMRTIPEVFPGGNWLRSDCHAWGAHILYHHFADGTILDPISGESGRFEKITEDDHVESVESKKQ